LRPLKDGSTKLSVAFAPASKRMDISGRGMASTPTSSGDVNPVRPNGLQRGTCHGAKDGKNGFKLSLRGYDPETDLRALTDDLASRRVNLASPDDSLMLLKAVAEVPHEGGRRDGGQQYYQIMREWIARAPT